jgi:4-aminobutyrate aminotransferase / (S)-3-amino-2-methylpropionate transaminase / 5-aminovalerate transaminase
VLDAIRGQLDKFLHTCVQVTPYEGYIDLAERMNEVTPGKFPKKTFFVNSGAEAVENAVKIARAYTKRPGIIAFEDAFHGRTMMTLASPARRILTKPDLRRFPARSIASRSPTVIAARTT